jgi:asparagine synthase (glutamine-hydrolysing)
MCGIAGMLLASGREVDPSDVEAMGRTLEHRGPDNFGSFVQGHYGVSHTRLSILDLSDAGNQPFRDGRYSLIYNGEIYNFLELRQQLIARGISLRSTSDTEVLFQHLITFGVEPTLPRLNGMFAFTFYDAHNDTLYVCRDRLGIKPLVYTLRNGDFFWASEVKALRPAVDVEIDPIRVMLSSAVQFDGRNAKTVFRGVRNVEPGTYLVVKPGQAPVAHVYHDFADEISESEYRRLDKLSMPDVVEQLRELMVNSLRGMLLSDAPMGVFASGGVDSSLIAAMALQQKPGLSLFTSNVVGKNSEIEDARLLSRAIGTHLHEADYSPEYVLDRWARATWYYEAPIIQHMNALPLGDVAELARRQRVKAVLTGEGSDELFLGYSNYVAKRYRKFGAPVEWMKSMYGIVPPARRYLFPKKGSDMNRFFSDLAGDFEAEQNRSKFDQAYSFLPEDKRRDQLSTPRLLQFHLASLLHRNDRMGMMAGIESRFPFLDNHILRFGLNLPARFKIERIRKIHNRRHPFLLDKAIVRHVCEGVVPNEILHKIKVGFPTNSLETLVLKPDFFKGGYVEEVFELTGANLERLMSKEKMFFAARMASVEVFGRLFAYEQKPEEVTAHLQSYAHVDPALQTRWAIT